MDLKSRFFPRIYELCRWDVKQGDGQIKKRDLFWISGFYPSLTFYRKGIQVRPAETSVVYTFSHHRYKLYQNVTFCCILINLAFDEAIMVFTFLLWSLKVT